LTKQTLLYILALAFLTPAAAQLHDTLDYRRQRDLIDLGLILFHKDPAKRLDTARKSAGRIYFSGAPSLSFSEVTGLGIVLAGEAAFYTTGRGTTNLSTMQTAIYFTANRQVVLPLQTSIWTKGNKYNFVGDWRFMLFPEDTYGLGGLTTLADGYKVDYKYVRVYQYALRQWRKDFFAGLGYMMDYHYNIEQLDSPGRVTDYDRYGFHAHSTSSGIALNVLYDTRENSINPEGGSFYGNAIVRQNLTGLGSDGNWTSLLLDVRKYFSVGGRQNILAFWSYDWLTLAGSPPYLDLPSTGWDTYNNTGRGYIQSRFRSKDMLDLEAEYRFGLTRNGLLGAVVFTNAETFDEIDTRRFEKVWPAVGAGVRIKFNKFSKTNVGIDYAWGIEHNNGLFITLGEVF
jgi:hypothetical protein